jgi:hypothetical protein
MIDPVTITASDAETHRRVRNRDGVKLRIGADAAAESWSVPSAGALRSLPPLKNVVASSGGGGSGCWFDGNPVAQPFQSFDRVADHGG